MDLGPSQLARHAENVFLFQGRHVVGARLIYQALSLNSEEGLAIRCLSDFLDNKGTEQLSAAVMEYALMPDSPLDMEQRRELDEVRFICKWCWGFSQHDSGRKDLGKEDFEDRGRFKVDDARYEAFLASVIALGGSLEGTFRGAHTLVGAMGGLLTHITLGGRAPPEEAFYPERFAKSQEYNRWLREKTKDLDALEQLRQQRTRRP